MWAREFNGSIIRFDSVPSIGPSLLLSVFIDVCIAKYLGVYECGSRCNVYGPCWTALSNTINSLHNINIMVYEEDMVVTSLPDMMLCLKCDWGHKMTEPFISSLFGPTHITANVDCFKRLCEVALSYERYGRRNPMSIAEYDLTDPGTFSVDQLGHYICRAYLRAYCEDTNWPATIEFTGDCELH